MKAWQQCALIAALSLAAATATFLLIGPPNRLFHCDPASLKPDELCLNTIPPEANVLWVDARSRSDWERSGVPGSILWNLDPAEDMQAFEAATAARALSADLVIVYCGDENCGVSRQVAARIRDLDTGVKVAVLRGGWRTLNEAGRVKHSQPKS